jgi:hypothetical protein
LSQFFEFFAGFVTELRAFVAEIETFTVQALNKFAAVSPTLWCQNLTTLTPHFFRRAFKTLCHSFQMCSIVLVGPIYATGATIETTSTN